MSTRIEYDAQVERRAGENFMVVRRTESITPQSGRGLEHSKTTRTTTVQVIPMEEVQQLMTALVQGLSYPLNDALRGVGNLEDVDRGEEPRYILVDGVGEQTHFWSYYEAEAHVQAMRAQGRHVKGWSLWRDAVDRENGYAMETFQS